MSDKTKIRARRIQEETGVSYTEALRTARGIEFAAQRQLFLPMAFIGQDTAPVHEEDLIIVSELGPTFRLNIHDGEAPLRAIETRVAWGMHPIRRDILVESDLIIEPLEGGLTSLTQADSLLFTLDVGGKERIVKLDSKRPQAIARLIKDTIKEMMLDIQIQQNVPWSNILPLGDAETIDPTRYIVDEGQVYRTNKGM